MKFVKISPEEIFLVLFCVFCNSAGKLDDTRFHLDKISGRLLQSHLERISDYMLCGENVWWHVENERELVFHDGDDQPGSNTKGPVLKDFSSDTLASITKYLKESWEHCLSDDTIKLPLNTVTIFNEDGDFVHRRKISKDDNTPNVTENTKQDEEQHEVFIIEQTSSFNTSDENEEDIQSTPQNSPVSNENIKILTPSSKSIVQFNTPNTSCNDDTMIHETPLTSRANNNQLKSSTAQLISKVICIHADLIKFDHHHIKFKSLKCESSRKICQSILPKLQENVKKEYLKSKSIVSTWEREFYIENGKEPCQNDMKNDNIVFEHYMKVLYAKKLLLMWKMSLLDEK